MPTTEASCHPADAYYDGWRDLPARIRGPRWLDDELLAILDEHDVSHMGQSAVGARITCRRGTAPRQNR